MRFVGLLISAAILGCGGNVVVDGQGAGGLGSSTSSSSATETSSSSAASAASSSTSASSTTGSGGGMPKPGGNTGVILNWEESCGSIALDDLSSVPSGIQFSWSYASKSGGYFYADSSNTAIAQSAGPIGSITDATTLVYSDYVTGGLDVGGIAVLRRGMTHFAAVRFDAFHPPNGQCPNAYGSADVSWFVLPPGDADFSPFQ